MQPEPFTKPSAWLGSARRGRNLHQLMKEKIPKIEKQQDDLKDRQIYLWISLQPIHPQIPQRLYFFRFLQPVTGFWEFWNWHGRSVMSFLAEWNCCLTFFVAVFAQMEDIANQFFQRFEKNFLLYQWTIYLNTMLLAHTRRGNFPSIDFHTWLKITLLILFPISTPSTRRWIFFSTWREFDSSWLKVHEWRSWAPYVFLSTPRLCWAEVWHARQRKIFSNSAGFFKTSFFQTKWAWLKQAAGKESTKRECW